MASQQKKRLRIPRIAKKLVRSRACCPGMFDIEFKAQVPKINHSQTTKNT